MTDEQTVERVARAICCAEAADRIEALEAALEDARRAFNRIAREPKMKAAMCDIASSQAAGIERLLSPDCERHGAPFISPGVCPFCDEEARTALNTKDANEGGGK